MIKGLAQAAVFGMRHDRVVRRVIECQQPAFPASLCRFRGGALQDLRRKSLEFAGIVYRQRPCVRRVLDIVVEVGLCCRERLHDFPEALLLLFRQVYTGQAKVAQGVGYRVPLRLTGGRGHAAFDPGIGLLQPDVL